MARMRFSGLEGGREAVRKEMTRRVTEDWTTLEGGRPKGNETEKELHDALDKKAIVDQFLSEWLPAFQRMKEEKDPDLIIREASPLAALTQVAVLLSGTERAKVDVSKEILNRTLGKPIERSMTLNADVTRLRDVEVDSEINRLLNNLPDDVIRNLTDSLRSNRKTEVIKTTAVERGTPRANEDREVQAEPGSEEISSKPEEN